jgi:hypothetical protein
MSFPMTTTMTPSPSLHPWDTWEGASLDEPIRACFRGRVYYFHDRRSAWNDSISQTYPGSRAFHVSMHDAKMAIENRHVQGSQWKIKELAALVVEGDSNALVVVQINSDNPFSDFTMRLPDEWTLEGAGMALESRLKKHVMRFVTTKGALAPIEGPQQQYKSRSVGSKDRYFLSWIGSPLEVNETSLNLILTRWNRALEEGDRENIQDLLVSPMS